MPSTSSREPVAVVIKGQRKMVDDVVKTIDEQRGGAADAGRATTQTAVKRVTTAKSASAKSNTLAKKSAAKNAPANKTMTGR